MSFTNEDRVNRRRPCPICGQTDWCLLPHEKRHIAICMRVESPHRAGKLEGWIHRLDDSPPPDRNRSHRAAYPTPQTAASPAPINWRQMSADFQCMLDTPLSMRLAAKLGVSDSSLDLVGFGWCGERTAYTTPMRDWDEQIIGIQLRQLAGEKWCVKGSRLGLFIPVQMLADRYDYTTKEPLLICEGVSDVAFVLDRGFDAIGRPSASSGADKVHGWLRTRERRHVVIMADADPVGQRSAKTLTELIRPACRGVRVLTPFKGKDIREWAPSRAALRAVVADSARR